MTLVLSLDTVTLDGTVATEVLLLVSDTTAPPLGAGPFNVTVPVALSPPTTMDGLKTTDARETVVSTGSCDVLVTPSYSAEIVTDVSLVTATVVTVNVALVLPLDTVTLDGTVATEVLLLDSDTTAPPLGAGPLSVTVPVEGLPPITGDGFKARDTSAGRMSKLAAFEVPPPGGGLKTVTLAVPDVRMSADVMFAFT